ncbi:MAG: BON domain-containing protein, partial [Deltaproteobacteria bacterium]|nr:BON domain-containing protein [Deltaproteobacteria bacterium]
ALTPESQALLEDLALASRIRANLAMHTSTEDLEVEVQARAGSVSILGKTPSRYQCREIDRIAKACSRRAETELTRVS